MRQYIPLVTRICTVLLAGIIAVTASSISIAQESGGSQERETKRTPTMSEAVYKKLLEAQEAIDAKDYEGGLMVLRELEASDRLSSYEKSQVFNFFAYTYFTLERYQDALNYYKKIIAEPDNTEGLLLNTLYTMAQLYFVIEDYRQAISTIDQWFTAAPEPSLNAYMLKGQAHYQLEEYRQALDPLIKARTLVTERGEVPKEMLLLLLQNLYLQLNDYPNMIVILRELVVLYPKAEHWRSLAGAYSELEQYEKQMSILEMLYESGNLPNGRSQMNLANLYLMHEAPFKAANLIDKGVKAGAIEPTIRNLRLLAQSWQQAQETQEALEPLRAAADLAEDGNMHVRLAQALIALDQYQDAAEALRAGIRKGGIDRPDQANIMLGMAEFELRNYEAAKRAFANAARDERSEDAAGDWLKYVESEETREEALERIFQQRRG